MDSLLAARKLLAQKKISSFELTKECLQKAKKNAHNAFISVFEDLALAEAKNCDENFKEDFLLQGIPYSLKDLFITEDLLTTAASKMLYNYIPRYQGHAAGCLKDAGGVLIGKNNCDEFGMGSTNEFSAFGKVSHPLDSKCIPGGSSGGSAVSVLEGSSFYSLGTDTGGSSRLPAHYCGLVGYKPSYGRISRYGQIAYGQTLDQTAPITRTVADMALVVDCLTRKDLRDSSQVLGQTTCFATLQRKKYSLQGLKIGYCQDLIAELGDEYQEIFQDFIKESEKNGVTFVDLSLPHLRYGVSIYYLIATSEASTNLARYDGIHLGYRAQGENLEELVKNSRGGFGPEVKKRIALGTYALSSGYYDAYYKKACQVRRLLKGDFDQAFESCDLLLLPTATTQARLQGEAESNPLQLYKNDLFTVAANLTGLPALALPYGQIKNHLPYGVQLMAPYGEDEKLIALSYLFEREKKGEAPYVA